MKEIESKWQKKWEKAKIFLAKPGKKKFYCLDMLPYPSGKLHMGHVRNYSIGDAIARFKRLQGFNVLYPMGYDSFGLPAENAAIKNKVNPKKWTEDNIKAIKKQQKILGFGFDWSTELSSHDPKYYRWNQWLFLKMLEKGLAYKKKSPINWCPGCKTVLANEQVEKGKCWRCKSEVDEKELEQWFFKVTDYADELLGGLEKLDWPENVKIMQRNWIGKSEGVNIKFKIKDSDETIETFTTRQDTMFGMTFIVVSPEHPKVKKWVKGTKYEKPILKFIEKVKKESIIDRTTTEKKEKRGVFLGKYAIHPFTGKDIPIYAADFVLLDFGTGIVQAVPAHDQRDFDFAKEYKLPIVVSVQPEEKLDAKKMKKAYEGYGTLVNSGEFTGMSSEEALKKISDKLEKIGSGKRAVAYKLRDWLISRQRYWGTPIPIIYCDKCGIVPDENLPVKLPEDVEFTGKGNPIETSKSFLNVKCPKCGGKGKRETDTMDTFIDSSWYFLRYCSPDYDKGMFDKEKVKYWLPVDHYTGGVEHAIMHLLYARFFVKVLRDFGLVKFDEPFLKLLTQGMVLKDGTKMSKSVGNIVEPTDIVEKYGADTARLFMLSTASPEKELEWTDAGIESSFKFIKKFFSLSESEHKKINTSKNRAVQNKLHKTIKEVTKNLDGLRINFVIRDLKNLVHYIERYKEFIDEKLFKECLENLSVMFSPFIPHISEEIWEKLGKKPFVSTAKWPGFDGKMINPKLDAEDDLLTTVIRDIEEIKKLSGITSPKRISIYITPAWKYKAFGLMFQGKDKKEIMSEMKEHGNDLMKYLQKLEKRKPLEETFLTASAEHDTLREAKDFIEKEFGCKVEILSAEKVKHPKSKTAEPGKPGILIE